MLTHSQMNDTKDVVTQITDDFKQRDIRPTDIVAKSWQRCLLQYGLDPQGVVEDNVLSADEISDELEQNQSYLNTARKCVTGLAASTPDAGYLILLTDETGLALDARLPRGQEQLCTSSGLVVGGQWSEDIAGTNGIGTCIAEQQSVIIHQQEHFLSAVDQISCLASPIFDPLGKLKGCLNVTALFPTGEKQQQHLGLQLVNSYANTIENAYLKKTYEKQIILIIRELHQRYTPASELLLAINDSGVIVGANSEAFSRFEFSQKLATGLLGSSVKQLLGLTLDQMLTLSHGGASPVEVKTTDHARDIEFSLQMPRDKLVNKSRLSSASASTSRSNLTTTPQQAAHTAKQHQHPSLQQLCGHDRRIRYNAERICRVLGKNIPILITGETGTGKEAFAKAFHDASNRASSPFIALNCAAIPESLIESELFGYHSGSFTGANRKGMKGKLQLANGGTIFLDEIGDMPVQLQTRLLRVLAEKEILPLGAEHPIPLDIQIISATHQDLIECIQKKLFREDLYYRLNGMSFHLPPLRSRNDKSHVISYILDTEQDGTDSASLDSEVLQRLQEYSWPGNIRQLRNVLRSALAVSENNQISLSCFPSDIRLNSESIPLVYPHQNKQGPDSFESPGLPMVENEEGQRLTEALRNSNWNITQTSESLGVCRSTIYRKMKKYNIVQPNELF